MGLSCSCKLCFLLSNLGLCAVVLPVPGILAADTVCKRNEDAEDSEDSQEPAVPQGRNDVGRADACTLNSRVCKGCCDQQLCAVRDNTLKHAGENIKQRSCTSRVYLILLGDVVCGGFAAPIREGYAEKVLIVTSGEKMALYAANNINCAVKNFEDRSYARVEGIILNRRNVEREYEKVREFADHNGLQIVAEIPRSDDIIRYEDQGMTVIQGDPSLEVSQRFLSLAQRLLDSEEIS